MGLLLIHTTHQVSWPFVLWPEFINSSCSQSSHDGSDDAILCYICGGGRVCEVRVWVCGENSHVTNFLSGRTSWHPFSTVPAEAISNICVKRCTELKNWGSLPRLSLPGSPPPRFLAPPVVTATSQSSHSGSPPQPSQIALGVPGGTSVMISTWHECFTTVSLHLWLIGCWILSLLL